MADLAAAATEPWATRESTVGKIIHGLAMQEHRTTLEHLLRRVRARARDAVGIDIAWALIEEELSRKSTEHRRFSGMEKTGDKLSREVRRDIAEAELDEIIAKHQAWIWSRGRSGEKAILVARRFRIDRDGVDLREADLRWADFSGSKLKGGCFAGADLGWACFDRTYLPNADFRNASLVGSRAHQADLWRARFNGANLWGCDFRGAILIQSNFDEPASEPPVMGSAENRITDFTAADLRDAKMRDAKMTTAFGADTGGFGGADLTNAQLPAGIGAFEALAQASEALKSIHLVLASLIAACAYIALTYAPVVRRILYASFDHHLAHGVKLPVVDAEVAPKVFAIVAPLVIVALYAFLAALLRRLWLALAALPAFFLDGTPIDERTYPSPLSGLVRKHLRLRQDGVTLGQHVERLATAAVVYGTAPATLLTLLIFDLQPGRSLSASIWLWHTLLFLACIVLFASTHLSLMTIVAHRKPRLVDRLHDAELRSMSSVEAYLIALRTGARPPPRSDRVATAG